MPDADSPLPDEHRHGRHRVRTRIRQRDEPSRGHRYRKWWRTYRNPIIVWSVLLTAIGFVVLLILNGLIRSPVPPPPE